MARIVDFTLSPVDSADSGHIRKVASKLSGIPDNQILSVRIVKRSIDARKRDIKVHLSVELLMEGDETKIGRDPFRPVDVSTKEEVIIVGAGPAGLFAALRMVEMGIRPVILERGKDVTSRKRDIAVLNREGKVDTESNYCFGEGGAGTFSDGKLYTRSKKKGNNRRVLELLCYYGANENILYEAHPHLGTDRLPGIIKNIRKSIIDSGGVIHFNTKVVDLLMTGNVVKGVVTEKGERFKSAAVVLATGHSSSEIFDLLGRLKIMVEFKPFAVGVRVEHPQPLIDRIRYHGNSRGDYLPAAEYKIVKQVDGRGVYSFCMCPGGFVVPSATVPNEVVVNGMSPSKRNSPYANSGIVVEVRREDLSTIYGESEFAGYMFRKKIEFLAWQQAGMSQSAPAQRLIDFVSSRSSTSLPGTSYLPGLTLSSLHEWLPDHVGSRLRKGFKLFENSMKGFLSADAVIMGVESRTSSPVRIPRNDIAMDHVQISSLYPCGEGSGYAGGIVSSAIDGMRIAEAIAERILKK